MKIEEKTIDEVGRQIVGLMNEHNDRLNRAFSKNGQEIEATFKVVIKSESPAMDVKTDISYLPEPKVKDSAHGRISPLPLFDENPFDRRTRLHTLWMIKGGARAMGSFDAWRVRVAA